MTADDERHGTVNGYCNGGCRCDGCREAWRLYEPALRAQERKRLRMGMVPRKVRNGERVA